MNIEINGVQITLTKEQLEEIDKQVNKPKDWRDKLVDPSDGYYHYIANSPSQNLIAEFSHGRSSRKRECAFKSYEQAELVAKKCNLMIEMHNFAYAMNDGWVPEFISNNQMNYGLFLTYGTLRVDESYGVNNYIFGVAVKSEGIAEQMLEEFGERIKEIYNTQY